MNKIISKSESKLTLIASSGDMFDIQLVERLGYNDMAAIIDISKDLSDLFGNNYLLTENNIHKYFNHDTLPFIATFNKKIIGYIIGVPLEYFDNHSWAQYDTNLGENNTIYTYAFLVNKNYRKKGGYSKTLKKIYLNWAKKRKFKFVTGHVSEEITNSFNSKTEIIKKFPNWYQSNKPFIYYRRPL